MVATVRLVTAVATVARDAGVVVAVGAINPFLLATGTPPAVCVKAVLGAGAPTTALFAFAVAAGVQGAAALTAAGAAAGFFLRENIDPRLEIAALAFVTALLAVSFCAPAEFATFVSVPGVLAPGGQGCAEVAIMG